MSAKSRVNLKAAFQTGDTPDGDDFADLIDSFANVTDTTAQVIAGNLSVESLTGTTVSAGSVFTDILKVSAAVSAASLHADSARVSGLSMHLNPYGEAFADVTAITSVEATATWTQVSATLTAPNASGFTVSGHDVTYTGAVTAKFIVDCQIETRGSAAQQIWLAVAKNGTVVSGTISKRQLTDAELAAHGTRGVMELKTSDVVSLRVQTPDGPIASLDTFGVKYLITPIYWG